MTRQLLLLALLPLAFGIKAQYAPPDPAGFQGIIVETYYVADVDDALDTDGGEGLVAGAKTYRVFVDLKPGYKLLTVGGFENHPFTMATTTSFFNNDDRGGSWGYNINDIHLDKNTVAIDTWMSVGAASDAHWGVLKSADPDGSIVGGINNDGGSEGVAEGLLRNTDPIAGIPLTTADGIWETEAPPTGVSVGTVPDFLESGGGNSFSEELFSYAVLGGVLGPDTANRILIGQFTTDGEFNFCMNLSIRIPDSLVCDDPFCHEIMDFYGEFLESDTAGGGFTADARFTHPTLCFSSASGDVDCLGVVGGPALPGTVCDDGDPDTSNDIFNDACACIGEDCEGILGGAALPGEPCDDNDPLTSNDTWAPGCTCEGIVGIKENGSAPFRMDIHPNPTTGLLQLRLEDLKGQALSYTLSNALAGTIHRQDIGRIQGEWNTVIDLDGLANGLYFLEVRIGGSSRTEKVLKY